MIKQVRYYVVCVFLMFLFWSCGDGGCNVIPNVTVHTTFSQANAPDAFRPNGTASLDGGVAGLLVFNLSTTGYDFVAYDRCSPINPEKRNRIEILNSFVAHDPASGAKWFLKDGSPMEVAECPLKPYRVGSFGNSYTIQN